MANEFLHWLGRLYQMVAMIVVTVFLGAATWLMVYLYQAEKRYNEFVNEGQPVTVQIREMDREPRVVWDQFVLPVYARFTYKEQSYEVRCINSNPYTLSVGSSLHLLYHPDYDAFEQPRVKPTVRPIEVVSPLVKWSVLNTFSHEHQLLAGLLLAGTFFFFAAGGLFAKLTGLTFLQPIALAIVVIILAGVAVFFSYDAIEQYHYVQRIQTEGQELTVGVTDTDQNAHGKRGVRWYTYDARFPFKNQQRVIAINESDYDRLPNGSGSLRVWYHPTMDDFVPVDYSLELDLYLTPLLFWIIAGVVLWNSYLKKRRF